MLTLKSLNPDKPLSVFLAVQLAEKALPIWEKEYPEYMRPREAIEAAKEWLNNPFATAAAFSAAYDAIAAAVAADDAVAAAAAYAAATAAAAAYAHDANNAHVGSVGVAAKAANALGVDNETFVHEVISERLDWILQYKIESGQSFAQPELIFDCLNEEQKQRFLFNLEVLR